MIQQLNTDAKDLFFSIPPLFVTQHKFVCLRHSEARQTEILEFGVYCRAMKERGGSCPKKLQLPKGFQQNIFKGQVRDGHPRACDRLARNSLIG